MRGALMRGMRLIVAVLLSLVVVGTGIAFAAQDSSDAGTGPALSVPPQKEPGAEIVDARTATSQTFRLPDGSRETRIFSTPINYLDAEGEWQPIEEGLEETGEGTLTNGQNSF